MTAGKRQSVAICIATFRRPEGLRAALAGIAGQKGLGEAEVTICVVDNDLAEAGRFVVMDVDVGSIPVEYEPEPLPGISYVRNRLIRLAGDCDFIAFIDDDEVPAPDWLATLLKVQGDTGADFVAGPVLSAFETAAPSWILEPFTRRRRPTGTPVVEVGAGNVLIRRAALGGLDELFIPELGITGGEDAEFFARLSKLGRRGVWADEATAVESVPPSRVRLRWVLARAYRKGSLYPVIQRLHGSAPRHVRWLVRGLARILVGVIGIVPSALLGRRVALRQLILIARGLGMIAGAFNRPYREYEHV